MLKNKKLVLNLKRKSWGNQEDGFTIYENTCKYNDEILEFLKNPEEVQWFLDSDTVGENHYYAYYQKNEKSEQDFKTKTLLLLYSFWPIIGHYKKKFGYTAFGYQDPEFLKIGKTKKVEKYEVGVTESATSFIIIHFLNDDYKGGELNFSNHKVKIKPKKNQTIFLNSNHVKYSISPIESGEQYVFVTSYKKKTKANDWASTRT
jgi:hypothetical protein